MAPHQVLQGCWNPGALPDSETWFHWMYSCSQLGVRPQLQPSEDPTVMNHKELQLCLYLCGRKESLNEEWNLLKGELVSEPGCQGSRLDMGLIYQGPDYRLRGKRGRESTLQALLFFLRKGNVAVAYLVLGTSSIPVCLSGLEVVSSEVSLRSLLLHYPHNNYQIQALPICCPDFARSPAHSLSFLSPFQPLSKLL